MVMGVAVCAAMGNHTAKKELSESLVVNGYIHTTNPEKCTESTQCSTSGSVMCTVNNLGVTRLWDKNDDGECIIELFRKP